MGDDHVCDLPDVSTWLVTEGDAGITCPDCGTRWAPAYGYGSEDSTGWVRATTTYADQIRAAMQEALTVRYEATGLILHPVDDARVRIAAVPPGPDRRVTQEEIAAAFDVPMWMLGVEGYRPPLRARIRALPHRARARVARWWNGLPFVHYEPDSGWQYDGPPDRGRWWFRVGPRLYGRVPDDRANW